MKHKKLILVLIFMAVLFFRLFFAFQLELSPDAYFSIRQAENIAENWVPLTNDPLSYGGRENVVFPAFYYVMALSFHILPVDIATVVLPNLFAASLIFVVYLISKYMTKNETAALFTAFISGFIPLFIDLTLNTVSPLSLHTPLIFLMLYSFMRINENWSAILFVILSFTLPIMHNSAYILIPIFLIYMAFVYIEKFQFKKRSYELAIFYVFVSIWLLVLVAKKALVSHGSGIFWQNVPPSVLANYFSEFTFSKLIGGIGIINLLIGAYVLQKYLFREKNKDVYLLASFILSVCFFLWLKIIKLDVGLAFLAIALTIFFGHFFSSFFDFIRKSHFSKFAVPFAVFLIVVFAFNSVVPSIAHSAQAEEIDETDINALLWAKTNTPVNATIFAPLEYGLAINEIAQRKNVADTQFMLTILPQQRVGDINELYSTDSTLKVVEIMSFYDAEYLFSKNKEFGSNSCLELIYSENSKIYRLLCKPRMERI